MSADSYDIVLSQQISSEVTDCFILHVVSSHTTRLTHSSCAAQTLQASPILFVVVVLD